MSSSLSILIVEDEPLIAMMLEDFLDSLGHRIVGTVDCVAEALPHVRQGGFDVAILDVHLRGGEQAWPVADELASRGIPFVVATGGNIEPPPARHARAPLLAKPFSVQKLAEATRDALRSDGQPPA